MRTPQDVIAEIIWNSLPLWEKAWCVVKAVAPTVVKIGLFILLFVAMSST